MLRNARTRLTVVFIGLAVLPLFVMGILLNLVNLYARRELALMLQQQVALRVSASVSAEVQSWEAALLALTEMHALQELPLADQEDLLYALLAYEDAFQTLTVLDATGAEVLRVSNIDVFDPEDLTTRASADEFLIPHERGEIYYGPIQLDADNERSTMMVALPLRDGLDDVQGVLVAEAGLESVWQLVADSTLSPQDTVYILDSAERIVAHRDLQKVWQVNTFPLPSQDGVYPGFQTSRVLLAMQVMTVGEQTFTVVAERSLGQALAFARNLLWITLISIAVFFCLAMGVSFLARRYVIRPLLSLTQAAQDVAAGDFNKLVKTRRQDEIGMLIQAFNQMTQNFQETLAALEEEVQVRTLDLERRSSYLQASAEVGHAAASSLDIEELLQQVTGLILERFDLYHVGLYLLNETEEWALYRAGTGTAGRKLLQEGWRLEVGGKSMVGWCIANARARVALDVSKETVRVQHALLPLVQSEAALPLIARGKVVGAINVQSVVVGTFDETVIAVLQTMCELIAVAIENTQLFNQSKTALDETRRAYGQLTRQSWAKMMREQELSGYDCDVTDRVQMVESEWQPQMLKAVELGCTVDDDKSNVVVPIKVRDQIFGVVKFRKPVAGEAWAAPDVDLMEALTAQLSEAVDSARLYQDTQRQALRERLTREITGNIRGALSVEDAIKRAIQEVAVLLQASEMVARIGSENTLLSDEGASHD